MQWFKHSTGSHDDPDLVDARNELGDKAIVIFWDILELYAEEFKHRDSEGWVRFSKFFLRSQLRRNLATTQSVLSFYEKRGRINCKLEGNFIHIQIPKFILLSSNWTRRPTEAPTEVTQEAPTEAPTAIEEEEKKIRIEEKKIIVIPEWIDKDAWDGFIEHRKKIKVPLTGRAATLTINKLAAFQKNGQDPNAILNQSVEMGWKGIFPIGGDNGRPSAGSAGKVIAKTGPARSDGAEYPVDFEA
jgi:hypothetical protein